MSALTSLSSRLIAISLATTLMSCAHDTAIDAPTVVAKPVTPKKSEIAATVATGAGLEVSVPTFENSTCPIMGKAVSDKLYVETDAGRIYVCCKACNEPILEDVSKAMQAAYPVTRRATNTVCPIMGDPVNADSPTVTRQGVEIPICCDACIPELKKNDQIVLAKLADPTLVDLQNATCPITGEPIAPNTFCIIGNHLIRLSSVDCVERAKQDPAGTIEKAKSLARKESSAG